MAWISRGKELYVVYWSNPADLHLSEFTCALQKVSQGTDAFIMCRWVQELKLTQVQGRTGQYPCTKNRKICCRRLLWGTSLAVVLPRCKRQDLPKPSWSRFPSTCSSLPEDWCKRCRWVVSPNPPALHPSFETKALALGHAQCGNTSGGDTSKQAACSKHWALGPDQPVLLWAQQPFANVEASTAWVMYSCPGLITTKMCQQASWNWMDLPPLR